MKSLAYKLRIQYIIPIRKTPIKYLSGVFAFIGAFYTVCDINKNIFNSQFLSEFFRNHYIAIILLIIVITIFVNKEKDEFSAYLGQKDCLITIKMDDLLKIKGTAVIIPTNTTFDTTMNDSFINQDSVQGQFQKKYYGVNFTELDKLLQFSLDEHYPNAYKELSDRMQTKRKRYDIGTVSKITIGETHYYFLAMADVSKTGKPQNVTMNSLTNALVGLWGYLAKEGHIEPVAIPVMGTGRGGLKDGNLEEVVHETIFSFISATQNNFVAKGLTICIYPPTLKNVNCSWNDLCNYLSLQCCFATENERKRKLSITSGNPVE